jgi:two-component system cell cycle sensor histidine kinase/response regulator CckA
VSFAWPETDILPLRFGLSGLAALCLTLNPARGAAPLPLTALEGRNSAPELIVVGAATDSYPYSFADAKGGPQGFSVDILDAVARAMNLSVRREAAQGREIQARFVLGAFDCLQSFTYSPSRENVADFSVSYLTLQGGIFVRKGGPVQRFEDFEGKPFAIVGRGSEGEAFLAEHHLHVQIFDSTSAEEALRKVASGECAGTFLSRLTALSVIYHAHIQGVTALGDPVEDHEIRHSCAVHKGNAKLLAQLNEGLAIIHGTGEYDRIYRKWFGRIDAPLFTHQQLVVYAVTALALALITALGGAFWQRSLRKRIGRQAKELAGQRALLQALYDNIPMGMTVIEMEAVGPRLISMNREAGRLYAIEPRAAINRLLPELPLAEGPRGHFQDVLSRRPASGEIVHYEYEFGQARRVLEVTLIALSAGGGTPHLCVLAEDISARKLMDAEIAQTRKLRAVGELVGGIAHEFNNLLTPVILKVGEIQMDWSGDAKLQQEIVVIAQVAQRAAELTRRLLTFGRKSEARADPVQLAEAVTNCFELLHPGMDRRIVWENRIPADLPVIHFNATELSQILINLLLNARDTLLEKLALRHDDSWIPVIAVSATGLPPEAAVPGKPREGVRLLGWQRLTVRDNGVGIPPSIGERIFEPFFTTKEVGKGTGLGLATVWHLITEAGGRIEMESKPGAGSSFHILLPVWPGLDAPAKPAVARAPAPATARVLLIEDEPLVAQTVQAILRRGGHEVHHIADGAEAWKHLAGDFSQYNLLVVDVNLPGLNGVDLVGRARSKHFAGRILVVSGRVDMADLRALVQLQVDRVLMKPFTAQQFEAALSKCVA